jgi:heme-degrading monooxygenase HmoA
MYARHTYVTGDPRKIDEAVTAIQKKGRELLRERPGYTGIAIFADRDLGKLLITSFWDSEQACRDSNEALREQRAMLLRPFAATISVDISEVAAVRRRQDPGEGAAMRRLVVEHNPADADRLVEAFSSLTAEMESIPGFCRSAIFTDRGSGRSVIGIIYADHDSLIASRSAAAGVRGEVIRRVEGSMLRSLEDFAVELIENLPA